MEILGKYSWPGNVRELENVLHSSSVISKGKRSSVKIYQPLLFQILINLLSQSLKIQILKRNWIPFPRQKKNQFDNKSSDSQIHTQIQDSKINFGEPTSTELSEKSISSAPTSISSEESFDMAYAHARKSTDRNLIETVEKEIIQRALTECGGNQVKASALLGITRATYASGLMFSKFVISLRSSQTCLFLIIITFNII